MNTTGLDSMRSVLEQHLRGEVGADVLVREWREASRALTLPPVFGQALEELLRRLEMASVFAQDSCSFSSTAVTDQLGKWLEKARAAASR